MATTRRRRGVQPTDPSGGRRSAGTRKTRKEVPRSYQSRGTSVTQVAKQIKKRQRVSPLKPRKV